MLTWNQPKVKWWVDDAAWFEIGVEEAKAYRMATLESLYDMVGQSMPDLTHDVWTDTLKCMGLRRADYQNMPIETQTKFWDMFFDRNFLGCVAILHENQS